jgi:spermidine/putrescine transport system permease protein
VQVYVVGTLMFLLALAVVVAGQAVSKRRNRQVA